MLEKVVLHHSKVVKKLDSQIAFSQYVVFDIDKAIHFDMDCEPIARELSRDLLIDFDEHVM